MPSLELTLLGGFRASLGAGEDVAFTRRKSMLVLACLALRPGEAQRRERMIRLFWSDRGETQARGSLRQALASLRRTLQPAAPAPLVIEGEQLWLAPGAVSVDVAAFESLAGSALPSDVERAVALYRGPFLDALVVRDPEGEQWLSRERERLRGVLLDSLERLLTWQMQDGAFDRAIGTALRIVAEDPLREDAHRALMQLYALRGRRSLALRQYQICRDSLSRSLRTDPEPDTEQLNREIQRRRLAAPDGVATEQAPRLAMPLKRSASTAVEPRRPAVAVLPFASIGGDADQECFADGLTEELITDLSQLSGLFVAARRSVLAFKDRPVPAQEAARELKVGHLLVGSVRQAGDTVRVTAQLVDGITGGHVWGQRQDRCLGGGVALQGEISKTIVDGLREKLLPEQRAAVAPPAAIAGAQDYYLMGRSFSLRGIDRRCLRLAREMFARACQIDPGAARAYAGIAVCDFYLAMSDPGVTFESTLANAGRALELDPGLAEAYAAKGLALYAVGRYVAATAEFERAIRCDPSSFEAQFFYARNCRLQGLHPQAAVLFERAAELRPTDFRSLGLLSAAFGSLGKREESAAAAGRCLQRLEAEIKLHPDNADALAFGGALLAELGHLAPAADWASRALIIGPDDYLVQYNVARTYALLGRFDDALQRLQHAFCSSPPCRRRLAEWMKQDEKIGPLRGEPRFQAFTRQLASEAVAQPLM